MKAFGTSSTPRDYSLSDNVKTSPTHVIYYRLQVVDLDGTMRYSPIAKVSVAASGLAGLTVWPNPFAVATRLSFPVYADGIATFILYTSSGVPVRRFAQPVSRGNNTLTLNTLHDLAAGMYNIAVVVNGIFMRQVLIKE